MPVGWPLESFGNSNTGDLVSEYEEMGRNHPNVPELLASINLNGMGRMTLDETEKMLIQIALKLRIKTLEEKNDSYDDYTANKYRELAEKLFGKTIYIL